MGPLIYELIRSKEVDFYIPSEDDYQSHYKDFAKRIARDNDPNSCEKLLEFLRDEPKRHAMERWDEFDLRWMPSLGDASRIPATARNRIIVSEVNGMLHFRVFNSDGTMVLNTDETKLKDETKQVKPDKLINHLRTQLKASPIEKARVIPLVKEIVYPAVKPIIVAAEKRENRPESLLLADRTQREIAEAATRRFRTTRVNVHEYSRPPRITTTSSCPKTST